MSVDVQSYVSFSRSEWRALHRAWSDLEESTLRGLPAAIEAVNEALMPAIIRVSQAESAYQNSPKTIVGGWEFDRFDRSRLESLHPFSGVLLYFDSKLNAVEIKGSKWENVLEAAAGMMDVHASAYGLTRTNAVLRICESEGFPFLQFRRR